MSHNEKGLNEFTSAVSQELPTLPCSQCSIPPKGPDECGVANELLWLLLEAAACLSPGHKPPSRPGKQHTGPPCLAAGSPWQPAQTRRDAWPAAAGRKVPCLSPQQAMPGESSLSALQICGTAGGKERLPLRAGRENGEGVAALQWAERITLTYRVKLLLKNKQRNKQQKQKKQPSKQKTPTNTKKQTAHKLKQNKKATCSRTESNKWKSGLGAFATFSLLAQYGKY